jgi:hypothetical protein
MGVRLDALRRLTARELVMLPSIVALNTAFGVALRRRGFEQADRIAERIIGLPRHADHRPSDPERIVGVVHLVSRRSLTPSRCLARSLTGRTLLARRGVDARVVVGTTGTLADLGAHAWLEVDGVPVGEGRAGLEAHRVLGVLRRSAPGHP